MIRSRLIPRSAVWALDFGESTVSVLAGCEKTPGQWQLLGEGRCRAEGRPNGEITKLSDACESVTEALRQAEKSAGLHCRKLYFNLDDAGMTTAHPSGSKTLSGEGQIRREDVRAAAKSASRMAGDFERVPVYVRDVHYLIDGKDPVGDPVGVFGHRLDVTLHMILARASELERWKNVMRRAAIERFVPILSLESCLYGLLERTEERRILWDLGGDFISGALVERGALREYKIFLSRGMKEAEWSAQVEAVSRRWMHEQGASDTLVLTGDRAAEGRWTLKTVTAAPKALPSHSETSNASVVGLLLAASHRERRLSSVKSGGQWARQAREKANAFLQEYF